MITLSKDVLHFCEEAQDHLTHENEYVEDQNLYRDAVHSCFNLGFEVLLRIKLHKVLLLFMNG